MTNVQCPTPNVFVLAYGRDGQRYVFLFDLPGISALLQKLGNFAADPDLNFTWYDAALLSQRARRLKRDYQNASS